MATNHFKALELNLDLPQQRTTLSETTFLTRVEFPIIQQGIPQKHLQNVTLFMSTHKVPKFGGQQLTFLLTNWAELCQYSVRKTPGLIPPLIAVFVMRDHLYSASS